MWKVERDIAALGGLATTAELLARDHDAELLRILSRSGRIRRVRKGRYALADTPEPILRAWAAGGRLACLSALAYFEGRPIGEDPLHVGFPRSFRGVRAGTHVIAHWSKRDPGGDRVAVSLQTASEQAARCTHKST